VELFRGASKTVNHGSRSGGQFDEAGAIATEEERAGTREKSRLRYVSEQKAPTTESGGRCLQVIDRASLINNSRAILGFSGQGLENYPFLTPCMEVKKVNLYRGFHESILDRFLTPA
jgi:hypothetical protein